MFANLSLLIAQNRNHIVVQANSVMTMLFWNIGKQIVSTQLVGKYSKNFEMKNHSRMMQVAEEFSDLEIVAPMARQLGRFHFWELIPLKDKKERLSYANEAADRR